MIMIQAFLEIERNARTSQTFDGRSENSRRTKFRSGGLNGRRVESVRVRKGLLDFDRL